MTSLVESLAGGSEEWWLAVAIWLKVTLVTSSETTCDESIPLPVAGVELFAPDTWIGVRVHWCSL